MPYETTKSPKVCTRRQDEAVLRLRAKCMDTKAIARKLGLTPTQVYEAGRRSKLFYKKSRRK